MKMLTKEHFADAADLLESKEWVTGYMGNQITSFCSLSALAKVSNDTDTVNDVLLNQDLRAGPAMSEFLVQVGIKNHFGDWAICGWNNRQQCKEDVIAAFRAFAKS